MPECHSTNSLLLDLSQKTNQPEGTVVVTDSQTRGRGQRGNGWEAEPGKNLTFSLLLKPHFISIRSQFDLTLAISLGLYDFVQSQVSMNVKIKWPNDLFVLDKKVAGILIENGLQGEQIQQSVVGIGLNINQNTFSSERATSLALETGRDFDLSNQLSRLLEMLEVRYLQLRAGKQSELRAAYLANLYGFGEQRGFVVDGQTLQGRIEGLDDIGKLMIRSQGELKSFGLKEISFLYE